MNKINKKSKKNNIFIFVILSFFLLSFVSYVSALELNPFANSKTFVPELKADMSDFLKEDFNSKYGVIQLSKTRFWFETDRIAEYSLTENTDQCLINCKSKGKAVLYTDGKLFDDKYFLNKKGIEVEIDSQYYIKEIETYYEDVPVYKEVCSMQKIISNDTLLKGETLEKEVCNQEILEYKKEERTKEVWKEYNFEVLKAGEYEWEIRGSKATSQSVDFIPTAHGKNLNEWAWWNGDWKYKREIKVKENSGSSLNNYSTLIYVPYSANMKTDFSDLRFTDSTETEELGYWIENKTDSSFAWIWVKVPTLTASSNTSIYMYYGNSGASSDSNGDNAFLFYDDFSSTYLNTTKWSVTLGSGTTANNSAGELVITGGDTVGLISTSTYAYTGDKIEIFTKYRASAYTNYNGVGVGFSEQATLQKGQFGYYSGYSAQNIDSNFDFLIRKMSNTGSYTNLGGSGTTSAKGSGTLILKRDSSKLNASVILDSGGIITKTATDSDYVTNGDNIYFFISKSYDKTVYFDYVISKKYASSEPTYIIGDEQLSEGATITLNSPANNLNSTSSTINFNATITPKEATIKNTTLNLNDEEYLNLYNTNETINYSKILTLEDGDYTWNITACWIGESTEEGCTESTTRTFIIDATAPTITASLNEDILYAWGDNMTVNYNITDVNLDSCWYEYGSFANLCYQESENIQNQTEKDGNCQLGYTGNNDYIINYEKVTTPNEWIDGNPNTYKEFDYHINGVNYYINYTIPSGINTAVYNFKYGISTNVESIVETARIDIPHECFIDNKVQLSIATVNIYVGQGFHYFIVHCLIEGSPNLVFQSEILEGTSDISNDIYNYYMEWNSTINQTTQLNCSANQVNITTVEPYTDIIIYANDTVRNENNSLLSFKIDTNPPNITVTSGNGTQPHYYSGINHTINFTIEDDNLDSGWWKYGEENIQIGYKASCGEWSIGIPVFSYYSYNLSNFTSKKPTEMIVYGTNEIYVYNSSGKNQINYSSIIGEGYLFNLGSGYDDIGIEWMTGNTCSGFNVSVDLYNLSGNLLTKDQINPSEISSFTTTTFVKIDEIKVGTKLNYTSGEIKSSSTSYQKELLQSIVYMNGTVVNQTKNTASTTYVLDVFMNPNPNEIVDRVEYWAREVYTSGTGTVRNRKVSPLKEEVRQFSVTVPVTKDVYDFKIYANDTFGNVASKEINWSYMFEEEVISYNNATRVEGNIEDYYLMGNVNGVQISSAIFNFNGISRPSSILANGTARLISVNNFEIPSVDIDTNISFYWTITLNNGVVFNSTSRTQLVKNIELDDCSSYTYRIVNITNYNEETLAGMTGTVEYKMKITNNDETVLSTLNGTKTAATVKLCSSVNLTDTPLKYDLQLRYFASNFTYKTYNIERTNASYLPIAINLYFLELAKTTQFIINYKDYDYFRHPGAIIQIQRQYLSDNSYKVVEIPLISDDGTASGSFNSDNVKYKLIVIQNGVVLDTFDNIFPYCQNIYSGICTINVRGSRGTVEYIAGDDILYSVEMTNETIILTYVIPSGTPTEVTLETFQNSRFRNNISYCSGTSYASGGTIVCYYNKTVGDSVVTFDIYKNQVKYKMGDIPNVQDINGLFFTNNYFIAFVLVMSIIMMFVTSGVMMILSAIGAVMYLAFVFLIGGAGVLNVFSASTSIVWLIIAGILLIYKLTKEEKG